MRTENFVHIGSHNEIFWCGECTHIQVVGQMALSPFVSSFACKFCHSLPLCVADYFRWIYYVVHRLSSISRPVINFGVHKHLVVNGKSRESMDEIRRLIVKEVDHTVNAKISVILLGANETFLVMHLLDDSGYGIVELLNNERLE